MVPAAAGGLIALLVGLGIYRVRQRKKANQVDSSFMESRLQPDSFFGASGGQKIDTGESAEPGSSLMYSPSQLDAGADVDPVAEADVYLAYGRDLQAEEILKEALRSNPSRAAIHFKLLQIYAKRRDVKGYAVTAANAYKLSSGSGSDWAHACAVGRELDPTNPLYQGEGTASFAELPTLQAEPVASPGLNLTATDFTSAAVAPAGAVASGDLDLDLDFSAGEPTASFTTLFTSPLAAAGEAEPATALRMDTQPSQSPSPLPDLEIELADPEPPAMTRVDAIALPSLDFDTPLPHTATEGAHAALPFDANARDKLTAPAPAPLQADPAHNGDMLEFDLNSLSLDLGDAASSAAPKEAVDDGLGGEDPLVTKLALAEEFQAIGDDDGARTLAQEVADAATGNLKTKAQRFLAELG